MRSQGGERPSAAFERLYTVHYREIAGYVRRRVAASEAEDVIAQVFLVAWRRLDRVPPPPDDRLWLFGVARNSVTEHRRSERRRLRLHMRLSHEVATAVPHSAESDSDREPVLAAIGALRQKDREALQLVLWEGLSHQEAAAVLGCSVNAFEIRYRRARSAVRKAVMITHPGPRTDQERLIRPPTASRSEP